MSLLAQVYPDQRRVRELEVADLDSLRIPASIYAGNQACRNCHGGAYEIWLGTGHARSWIGLDSEVGRTIAERMEVSAENPSQSAKCLTCHATAADVSAVFRAADFHVEEGVKCENCHGPGGEHVAGGLQIGSSPILLSHLRTPAEEECLQCHKEKPSHEMLNAGPFEFEKAVKKVAHPEDRGEKLALFRARPRVVLTFLLRRILYELYTL